MSNTTPLPTPESPEAAAQAEQEVRADMAALEDTIWQRDVLRPLLIAGVSSAFLVGPLTLVRLVTQEPRYMALLPFFVLITLQAVYTR